MARVSRRNKIAAAQTGQLPSPMTAQIKNRCGYTVSLSMCGCPLWTLVTGRTARAFRHRLTICASISQGILTLNCTTVTVTMAKPEPILNGQDFNG